MKDSFQRSVFSQTSVWNAFLAAKAVSIISRELYATRRRSGEECIPTRSMGTSTDNARFVGRARGAGRDPERGRH